MVERGLAPHRAVLILVLGIVGLIVCQPVGIAAWVMGNGDMKQMDAGHMDPTGRGMTQAGKILGIIATILLVIAILWAAVVMIVGIGVGISQR